ncbi:alpha/beta hydrolase [Roseobacter weihaiensis]|uniref:alpha/beta hydrolase n=1 Tax=Roseobacter weihaiensis TaxID=2763262 RepID=UPI001D0B28C5|nr:alpha/beta fold hydrolase [Roseobacter sp. H9]
MTRFAKNLAAFVLWAVAALAVILSIWQLEAERATVSEEVIETQAGAVSLYRTETEGPLVVITHGFAGSRQMMQYISRDLARAGFTVAAFDFLGHGRNPDRMSADVSRIEGTTQQLVGQTRAVVQALQQEAGLAGPLALLGHSMATDIIIRAAEDIPDVAAIVAISMYSDAITADFPERLLILSGQWEDRLRAVALDAVALVGDRAEEAETVRNGLVLRRAVSVPRTEHVAVLFAPLTMQETRAWLNDAFARPQSGQTQARGRAILALLVGLAILMWPLTRLLPARRGPQAPVPLRTFLVGVLMPVLPAMAAAVLLGGGLMQTAAFGALLLFFAIWGSVALIVLVAAGYRPQLPRLGGIALLLLWGLGAFALALDRYAAAFLPTGPRVPLMLWLLLGTVPFVLADRVLAAGAPLWRRVTLRVVPVVALSGSMIVFPQSMGVLFTVLPVMVLFFVVYGTMARAVAVRTNPETAALALAVILAWSIAASTPLFVG